MNTPTPNDGGPAFPVPNDGEWLDPKTCTRWKPFNGMTLRDYFAGQALAGILANFNSGKQAHMICGENSASKAAFSMADAMIAARERKEGV